MAPLGCSYHRDHMYSSIRGIRRQTFLMLLAAAVLSACTTEMKTSNERTVSDVWTRHSSTVAQKTITFELPPGGNFNPAPNSMPSKFGETSIAGVSYDQRPQGAELASLRVAIQTRRYAENAPATAGRSASALAAWADSAWADPQPTQFLSLEASHSVSSNGLKWH